MWITALRSYKPECLNLNAGMAHLFLHGGWRLSVLEQQAGVGVPEHVELECAEPGWGWSGTLIAPSHPSHVTQTSAASMLVTPSVLVGQRARRPDHVPGRGADASTRSAGIATRPYAKSAGRSSAWLAL